MCAERNSKDRDEEQRARRPTVKVRFDSDVLDRNNKVRRDHGMESSTVVLHWVEEIEREIPPFRERYGVTSNESADSE